jgi:hypothetical protein
MSIVIVSTSCSDLASYFDGAVYVMYMYAVAAVIL